MRDDAASFALVLRGNCLRSDRTEEDDDMTVKTVLVLCACIGLAISAAVEPSTNSELPSNPASNIPGVSVAEGFVKIPISIAKGFADAFQGAIQPRAKRQVQNPAAESSNVPSGPSSESQLPSNPASNIPGASEIQNGVSIAQGFAKIPISIAKGFADAVQGAVESRPKRQVPNPASAFQGVANAAGSLSNGSQSPSNIASNIPGVSEIQKAASGAQGFSGIASSVANGFANAAQGIAGRFQDAFNATYQDERNSVSDSFNSVKDQIKQNVDTGANLTKTAFDLGTVVPKFGKNLIIGGN